MPKTATTIRLSPEDKQILAQLAKLTGTSVSGAIRISFREALARRLPAAMEIGRWFEAERTDA